MVMAPLDDYLSDTESARICGVSVNTLNRFIETGYLKVEHDHDGLRLFSKNQLKRVFGVGEAAFAKTKPMPRVTIVGNTAIKTEEPKIVRREPIVVVEPEAIVNTSAKIEDYPQQEEKKPHLTVVPTPPVETVSVQPEAKPIITEERPEAIAKIKELESRNQILEMENGKFQNVITLLEKMLDIRESEIDSLKRQQQWLEQRVEKMEERSHREQLLLLAESETVRKLVVLQKRSPVRAALEWLGLAESTDTRSPLETK